MEFNQYSRALAVAVFGLVASFQVSAFTGGVTTYDKPAPETVRRSNSATARAGPEHDATYQRTMRTSQTAAAAATATGKILKGFAGIGTALAVLEFAREMAGIWEKNAAGENVLVVEKSEGCTATTCLEWSTGSSSSATGDVYQSSKDAACAATAAYQTSQGGGMEFTNKGVSTSGSYQICTLGRSYRGADQGDVTFYLGSRSYPRPAVLPKVTLTDAQLSDALKANNRIPLILDDLDDKGVEIPWLQPEVEDMPQPLVLSPKTITRPDGSKTIEKTTLTPYRGPDGTTVNWDRKVVTEEISKPAPDGTTTTTTTTSTQNTGPSTTPPATAPTDNRSECEKSPKTIGCAEIDVPEGDIPKTTKNVSYVAETLFGSGACPADISVAQSLTGRSIKLSYTPTCNALANYVKPIIIAIALFMAYLIILPGRTD